MFSAGLLVENRLKQLVAFSALYGRDEVIEKFVLSSELRFAGLVAQLRGHPLPAFWKIASPLVAVR
jgi:hypothetical protein